MNNFSFLTSNASTIDAPNNVTCQDLAAGNVPNSNFSTWWSGYTNTSYMLDNWLAGTGTRVPHSA